jgi:DNA-directed RNA polymerase specialized sigma24 family protein
MLARGAHTLTESCEHTMNPLPRFDLICEETPAERALALRLVTETDLLRLKAIARLHARLLPADIGWSDLLQEAFARVLDGSRRQPPGLPLLPFLAGVMRSIKAEYGRRARRETRHPPEEHGSLEIQGDRGAEPPDPRSNVERSLEAMQELAAICDLFAGDPQARQVICGLAEERSPEEICERGSMSKTDYDSTRKRMRRVLLREGLRTGQK